MTECLDPEKFAAWADRALSVQEASKVEQHLATCPRCQAMAAAFAQTDVPAPAAVPWSRRWAMRWFVPAAAGLAAATILFATIWRRAPVAAVNQTARSEMSVGGQTAPAPVSAPGSVPAAAPASAETPKRTAPKTGAASRVREPEPTLPRQTADAVAAPTPPAPATPAPAPAPAPAPLQFAAPAAAPRMAMGAVGGAGRASSSPASFARTSGTIVSEFEAGDLMTPLAAAKGVAGGRGGAVGGIARDTFAVSAPPVRWRILSSGLVERLSSGGTNWEPVAIDPPAFVTAGAAPSRTTCWLVGRNGMVLLSTDAVRFTRLTFPEAIDLTAVRAVDATGATVTTIDGRTFTTTDGGRSWRLQGFPPSSF